MGIDLDLVQLARPLCLSSEVAYIHGLRAADHNWSDATFGISTKIKMTDNLIFAPGLYHQMPMDDSVRERDKPRFFSYHRMKETILS